jgi:DNA-binding MarR family transcriptional regulator
MTPKEKQLYAVFSDVRTCFNHLKTLAEQLHQDLGVNPSMRAVMETLAVNGQQTVPDIASVKGVSRQHIQTIMNALLAGGLVESLDNPAHKRSPLFDLTVVGREAFARIREREEEPLRRLASAMTASDLKQAHELLALINKQLTHEIAQGDQNGN